VADLKQTKKAPADQLWEQLDDVHAGMLFVDGSNQHPQPMAPICDRDGARILFFTKRDTDLFKAVQAETPARFVVMDEKSDYYASLHGALKENTDRQLVEDNWNDVVAAWYEGKDDPNLAILELRLFDAAVWASVGGVRFGWEILKANLTDREPDVGVRGHVDFRTAA